MRHQTSKDFEIFTPPLEVTLQRPGLEGYRFREIEILRQKKIGEGYFGAIYEIKVRILSETAAGESNPALLIAKIYKDTERRTATEALKIAVENYEMARKAKLPVPATFRIGGNKDQVMLVITPGHRYGALYFSAFPQSDAAKSFEQIYMNDEVIQSIARQMFEIAYKAAKNNIILRGDAYLFQITFDEENQPRVRVEIGDFDNLEDNLNRRPDPTDKKQRKPKPLSPELLQNRNTFWARSALDWFLVHYQTRQITDSEVEAAIRRAQHGR